MRSRNDQLLLLENIIYIYVMYYIYIVTVVRRRSDEWGIAVVARINYRQDSLWESIPVATDDTVAVTCLHNKIYCNFVSMHRFPGSGDCSLSDFRPKISPPAKRGDFKLIFNCLLRDFHTSKLRLQSQRIYSITVVGALRIFLPVGTMKISRGLKMLFRLL